MAIADYYDILTHKNSNYPTFPVCKTLITKHKQYTYPTNARIHITQRKTQKTSSVHEEGKKLTDTSGLHLR